MEVAKAEISTAKEFPARKDFPGTFGLCCFRTSVGSDTRRTLVAVGSCSVGIVAVGSAAKEAHILRPRFPVGNFVAARWNLASLVLHFADRRLYFLPWSGCRWLLRLLGRSHWAFGRLHCSASGFLRGRWPVAVAFRECCAVLEVVSSVGHHHPLHRDPEVCEPSCHGRASPVPCPSTSPVATVRRSSSGRCRISDHPFHRLDSSSVYQVEVVYRKPVERRKSWILVN